MDRPSRKTKVVNYSDFQDVDGDEDFARVKAPPRKKAKEDVKQHECKKPSSKSSSQETDSQSNGKKRKPLDDKLYDRDLEAAVALSMLQTTNCKEDQSPSNKDAGIQPQGDENTDPSSLHLSNCSVDISVFGLDMITAADQGSPCAPSRQRNAASLATERQRSMLKDEDEDYQPKLTPDSESDEDFSDQAESEDEEFTVKKVIKTSKTDKRTKNDTTKRPPVSKREKQSSKEKEPAKPSRAKSQTTAVSTSAKSPPAAKLAAAHKRPPTSSTTTAFKPAVSLSPAGGRIPAWNPPGQIGKSPSSSQSAPVKSPGQGLRLGLSRRVRVKPLHPSVASH